MRYVSHILDLPLVTYGGEQKYKFNGGVLVVGDPTLNSDAADKIDATQTSPVKETELQVLYDAGSTDLEKVGLNKLFWEAPPITPGTSTVTAGKYYEVIKGKVRYNGVDYKVGQKFWGVTGVADSSDPYETSGRFAYAVPPEYAKDGCCNGRTERFKLAHLEHGQEAKSYYDIDKESGYTPWDIGSTLLTLDAP